MSSKNEFLKESFLPLIILIAVVVVLGSIAYFIFNFNIKYYEEWPSLGLDNAPVTIVEYSDYTCPFCERFSSNTLPLIKENYIEQGLVRFVYKDFAIIGGNRAAEAAHCAGEQGKYWEYHDLLFENLSRDRSRWSDSKVHLGYAETLRLNTRIFTECFESRKYKEKVEESTEEAINIGGTGTPFFVINDEILISGAQPFEVFQEAIEYVLQNGENN